MDREFIKGLLAGMAIVTVTGLIYFGADQLLLYLNDNGIHFEEQANVEEVEKIDQKLNKILSYLDAYYYEDLDDNALIEGAYEGLLTSIGDPYSVYYTKEQYEDIMEATEGVYGGIGSYISYDPEEEVFVLLPFVGSPSEEAGVLPGDILIEVDGIEVGNKDLEETVGLVKGEEGTEVIITVYREQEDEIIEIPIIRGQINAPTIGHELLEDNIGYIQITEFDEVTYEQFMEAFYDLEAKGQQGLIIDLRNNPGGLLHIVSQIADELLPEGLIVYTEDKAGNREVIPTDEEKQFNKPLVILINGNSASASEILAGAVKDHQVGTLVGTTTFGKGLVQRILSLGDGSAIKLTISRYFTPNGDYIHDKGIEPDIVVELPEDLQNKLVLEKDEDIQLEKAIETIKEAIQ